MTKIKLNSLDYVLIVLSIMGIISAATRMIDKGNYDSNIATICWILTAMGWFYLSKLHESRIDRLKSRKEPDHKDVATKAITSAPSQLNTYEKGIYEYGFKDGVNYYKKELEKAS